MPAWPEELPQNPFAEDDADYKTQDTVLVSKMEAGPAKLRPRFTAAFADLSFSMTLSREQWLVLDDFYRNVCKKVLPFDWIDFRSGAPAKYRFKDGKAPQERYFAGDGEWWQVAVVLEKQP